jgi:hypothetical protein
MYQFIRQMITGKEVFGLTPRVTFGDLISMENTRDRAHMLQSITEAAHDVLKRHMESAPSHIECDRTRGV